MKTTRSKKLGIEVKHIIKKKFQNAGWRFKVTLICETCKWQVVKLTMSIYLPRSIHK